MIERHPTPTPFLVEPARPDELPRLYALAAGAFSGERGWSSSRTAAILQRAQVYVAHDGRQPVGYVAVELDGDGWRIEQLLVAPGHERRGIGRLLLAYAEGLAISRQAHALRIVCEERNLAARHLYQRLGFAPVARELFERTLPQR
jgi:ribosomal protein S18 acetylase RimI-like enzyme